MLGPIDARKVFFSARSSGGGIGPSGDANVIIVSDQYMYPLSSVPAGGSTLEMVNYTTMPKGVITGGQVYHVVGEDEDNIYVSNISAVSTPDMTHFNKETNEPRGNALQGIEYGRNCTRTFRSKNGLAWWNRGYTAFNIAYGSFAGSSDGVNIWNAGNGANYTRCPVYNPKKDVIYSFEPGSATNPLYNYRIMRINPNDLTVTTLVNNASLPSSPSQGQSQYYTASWNDDWAIVYGVRFITIFDFESETHQNLYGVYPAPNNSVNFYCPDPIVRGDRAFFTDYRAANTSGTLTPAVLDRKTGVITYGEGYEPQSYCFGYAYDNENEIFICLIRYNNAALPLVLFAYDNEMKLIGRKEILPTVNPAINVNVKNEFLGYDKTSSALFFADAGVSGTREKTLYSIEWKGYSGFGDYSTCTLLHPIGDTSASTTVAPFPCNMYNRNM